VSRRSPIEPHGEAGEPGRECELRWGSSGRVGGMSGLRSGTVWGLGVAGVESDASMVK
jgi:hypothetical protein